MLILEDKVTKIKCSLLMHLEMPFITQLKKKDMSLNKRAIYTLLDSKDSNFIFGIIDINKLKNK